MAAQIILSLSILVGLHEAGHLVAAKVFGMRVEKYSIGFPPKIFGFKWGENGMEENEDIEIVKAVIGMLKAGLKKTEIKRLHNFPNYKKIYQIINREEYSGYWR